MADDDEPAVVAPQVVAQPNDRVGVEVVGGLVEQQGPRSAEKDAGEFDPAPLPPGQGAQPLPEDPLRQAERRADPRRLGLGGVPAEGRETLLQAAVLTHGAMTVVAFGHRDLQLGHAVQEVVEAARGQHPVAGADRQVAGARVLRQVADVAADLDAAAVRQRLAGQHPQQGCLARAVAADEPDAVAGCDLEGGVGDQNPGAGMQFQRGDGDHGMAFRR